MEHITPRSKGGATEWKNVVLADKRINNIRGNRTLEQAGLTLKIQPRVPAAKPFHEKPSKSAQISRMGAFCTAVARRLPAQMRLTADSESPNRSPIESNVIPDFLSFRISPTSLLGLFQRP